MATPQTFWQDAMVKRVLDRINALPTGRKVFPTDTEASKTLREIAEFYIREYNGSFEFMLSLQRQQANGYNLSPAKLAGALNSMAAEARYLKPYDRKPEPQAFKLPEEVSVTIPTPDDRPVKAEQPATVTPVIHDGTYTVVLNEQGEYRTLKIVKADPEQVSKYKLPQGAQIASFLSGADNESNYTGFAFVKGPDAAVWARFKADSTLVKALKALLTADKEARIDMGHAYALESGRCWRCGRKLTVPASINRGLGPICADKL